MAELEANDDEAERQELRQLKEEEAKKAREGARVHERKPIMI